MGDGHYFLTLDGNRWGTTQYTPYQIKMSNGNPQRGPVVLNIHTQEFPAPWQPRTIIQ